jgi:transcriptional regulator with XRE-family HTH domain
MAATVPDVADPTLTARHLRAWRERRRLSQLEVALRAGTTQRHLSFLERGRSLPGRAMILRLAEVLEVPLRDRNVLLVTAGYAPAYPETPLADGGLAPVRSALEGILAGHLPCPAVLTDADNVVVAGNAAFELLVAGVEPELRAPRATAARLLLDPGGLRPRIANLEAWGWHVIDGLRRLAEHAHRPSLARLADELVPELPPRRPEGAPLGVAVPLVLRSAHGDGELALLTTHTHFGTAIDVTVAELTLEAFLPADAATAEALAEALRTGVPA